MSTLLERRRTRMFGSQHASPLISCIGTGVCLLDGGLHSRKATPRTAKRSSQCWNVISVTRSRESGSAKAPYSRVYWQVQN
jgi:hypothetical protein